MSDSTAVAGAVRPLASQPELPRARFIVEEEPDSEAVPMDVLFVGAGPAGLAGAIELARLAKEDAEAGGDLGPLEIGVLEKAARLGEHSLSGAVVNPRAFPRALPRPLADRLSVFASGVEGERLSPDREPLDPSPHPTHDEEPRQLHRLDQRNGAMARRKSGRARCERVSRLSRGFATRGGESGVVGVRTAPSGLDRHGEPGAGHQPAMDLTGRVTVLSEGTRGALAMAYLDWQDIASPNPQIYALGVKELWQTHRSSRPDRAYAGVAPSHGCVRRELHVSAGGRPDRAWSGGRAGLRGRVAGRA